MDKKYPVSFKYVDEFPGWEKMPKFIEELIIRFDIKSVFEIGAGANPTLSPDIVKMLKISYTLNDVDKEELDKADAVYERDMSDLCRDDVSKNFTRKYDLVFSRMAGEHFYNAKNLHSNIYKLLNDGGYSIHCFSTLYAFPFLINKITPEWISDKLLAIFNPRDSYHHKKFKAYYDMSFGPSSKMIRFFISEGYQIINYSGYYGHPYYKRISLLNALEKLKADWLVKHPIPLLTSYATIILKKSSG
jgi:hypothetical protein